MIKLTWQSIRDFADELHDEIDGQGRWNTYHRRIFTWTDGKTYETYYERGSTEYQEGTDGTDILECYEVEQVKQIVTAWICAGVDANKTLKKKQLQEVIINIDEGGSIYLEPTFSIESTV